MAKASGWRRWWWIAVPAFFPFFWLKDADLSVLGMLCFFAGHVSGFFHASFHWCFATEAKLLAPTLESAEGSVGGLTSGEAR